MKVSHVTTRLIRTPADNPLVVGIDRGNATRDFVTLELGTDQGLVGIGLTFFGGALSGALREARSTRLARLTIGEDPLRRRGGHGQAPAARRAARGRAASSGSRSPPSTSRCGTSRARPLGQPLATLLGGHRDRVPTYASGALMRPHPVDYLAKAGPRLVDMGFRQMKMQCGARRSRRDGRARARDARVRRATTSTSCATSTSSGASSRPSTSGRGSSPTTSSGWKTRRPTTTTRGSRRSPTR